MQSNVQHAGSQTSALTLGNFLPTITPEQLNLAFTHLYSKTNYFGFDRADLAYKLVQYLRFGNVNSGASKIMVLLFLSRILLIRRSIVLI